MRLRYLASGMSQKDVARYFRIGRSTASGIIYEVCTALWEELAPEEMPMPSEEGWKVIAEQFAERWNFPGCLGEFVVLSFFRTKLK